MTRGKTSGPTGRYHPNTEPSAKGSQPNTNYPLPSPKWSLGKKRTKTDLWWELSKVKGGRKPTNKTDLHNIDTQLQTTWSELYMLHFCEACCLIVAHHLSCYNHYLWMNHILYLHMKSLTHCGKPTFLNLLRVVASFNSLLDGFPVSNFLPF